MKAYGGVDVQIHILTSALAGVELSASRPGIHWIGSWVDPKADLHVEKILDPTGTGISTLGRPARSQSPCRLCYHRSSSIFILFGKPSCHNNGLAPNDLDLEAN
jgi:hypothetical protein